MEDRAATRVVDLSHVITDGMVTYKGLPGPHICDFLSREQSAANYDGGETFQIGRIDMVANTSTYVDVPSHRFADGADLSEVGIEAFAHLPALVVRQPWESGLAVDVGAFEALDVRGCAVLVATGWDRHWATTLIIRTIRSSPSRPRSGWSIKARLWSGSIATISTTRGFAPGRFTLRFSARASSSASI